MAALALALASFALSGCAKKHRIATVPSVPAPIQSTETGLASWYGHPYHGRQASNGEIYDMEKLTAAHRTLPFGTWVRVTNLTNAKTVDVRIIDRGPFVDGRIIDLSHAAAQAIDMIAPGVAEVRVNIISLPALAPEQNWYAVQVGAFQDKDRAERLRASLEPEFGPARLILRRGYPPMWRVLVGKFPTEDAAGVLARRLQTAHGSGFVVRLDDSSPNIAGPTSSGSQP